MDALWDSWSDLAAAPTSRAARSVVLQRAGAAADALNQFDARLLALREQTTLRVDATLGEANGLARRVAELNGHIVRAEVGGQGEASDLRDERDAAVDRLAALTGATAEERPDGSVQVTVAGYTLVDGIHPRALTRTTDALGRTALALADTPGRALKPIGGSAQAMATS
jgi:flagellar hook-associated protein 1 FlgK